MVVLGCEGWCGYGFVAHKVGVECLCVTVGREALKVEVVDIWVVVEVVIWLRVLRYWG